MKRALSVCLLIFALFCTSACSGKMGYGVVLWSIPEHGLFDGTVVPVYVRSNIGKVYIIGIPGSKQKIEVPLWRITDPESKGKALKTAQRLAEYRRQYAVAALDGLPIRTEPVNTAKQVYRLRLNEVIKVLYKGEGQAVMAGKTPAPGLLGCGDSPAPAPMFVVPPLGDPQDCVLVALPRGVQRGAHGFPEKHGRTRLGQVLAGSDRNSWPRARGRHGWFHTFPGDPEHQRSDPAEH